MRKCPSLKIKAAKIDVHQQLPEAFSEKGVLEKSSESLFNKVASLRQLLKRVWIKKTVDFAKFFKNTFF